MAKEATIVGKAGHMSNLVVVYEWTSTQATALRWRRRQASVHSGAGYRYKQPPKRAATRPTGLVQCAAAF